jgi:hypothetical protein
MAHARKSAIPKPSIEKTIKATLWDINSLYAKQEVNEGYLRDLLARVEAIEKHLGIPKRATPRKKTKK